jgi:transcriptional regulator with XRE-family HTH domain
MLSAVATIGENIRRLRSKAGYSTQGAFATALGVPQPRLSDWENDRWGVPETLTLVKIAKILDISVDELLAEVDQEYEVIRTRDLPRQTGVDDGSSKIHSRMGGTDGLDSAAVRTIHAVIGQYESVVREVKDVTDRLIALHERITSDPLGREDRAPTSRTSHRRRRR